MSKVYHVFFRLSQLQYLAKTKCDFGISCLNCCIAVDFEVKENIQWSCTTDYMIFNIWIFWCIIDIYIYTRKAWVLPRRCSVEVPHSQTNDVANYRNSYGEITKVLGTIKQTRSKHPKFLWEKQNGITFEIPMGKTTKVLGNFKLSNRET